MKTLEYVRKETKRVENRYGVISKVVSCAPAVMVNVPGKLEKLDILARSIARNAVMDSASPFISKGEENVVMIAAQVTVKNVRIMLDVIKNN